MRSHYWCSYPYAQKILSCNQWSKLWQKQKQLPSMPSEKRCRSRMSLSQVMTIAIAFHGSRFHTFKEFYTLQVLPHWKKAFPNFVSYNRASSMLPERSSGHTFRVCRTDARRV